MKLRRQIKWRRTKTELVLYGAGVLLMLLLIRYLIYQTSAPPAGE